MQSQAVAQSVAQSVVQSAAAAISSPPAKADQAGGAQPFAGLFHDAVANVQHLEAQASSTVEGLLNGSGVDIHSAMIATEKSDMAFELALSVRGKAIGAYQQLMGMQF